MFNKTNFASIEQLVEYVGQTSLATRKLFVKGTKIDPKDFQAVADHAVSIGAVSIVEPTEANAEVDETEEMDADENTDDDAETNSDTTLDVAQADIDAAKDILSSADRTLKKLTTVYNKVSADLESLINGGIVAKDNASATFLVLLANNPVDDIKPTKETAQDELSHRIAQGMIKANAAIITPESYAKAQATAITPADKLSQALETWKVDNAEDIKALSALMARIDGSLSAIYTAHSADKKYAITPVTGAIELENTLSKKRSSSTGASKRKRVAVTGSSGKRITIRGLDRKGNIDGHELHLTSDETDWYLSIDGTTVANHALNDKVTPSNAVTQWLETNYSGTQRSIYDVFGRNAPIYYGVRPTNCPETVVIPSLPADLAK